MIVSFLKTHLCGSDWLVLSHLLLAERAHLREAEDLDPRLVPGAVGGVDLVLNEDQVLHVGGLLEDLIVKERRLVCWDFDKVNNGSNLLEFRQQLVRGNDVRDLRLCDPVCDGLLPQVGVQGDEGEGLLEAAQGADEPLGLRLSEDAGVFAGLEAEGAEAVAEVGRLLVDLQNKIIRTSHV